MTAPNPSTTSPEFKPKTHDRLGRPIKHGRAATPEYRAWQKIHQRCYNPRNQRYDRYGERGITVCQRWRESFEAFYADMGPRPSAGHSIDRIDNDGHYCPENCRWATRHEQNRNRSGVVFLEHNGKRQCIADWAKELGINTRTLCGRIASGMSHTEAITTPVAPRKWRSGKVCRKLSGVPPVSGSHKYPYITWNRRDFNWQATLISPEGKRIHVGMFDTQEEAIEARNKMAFDLFGDSVVQYRVENRLR